MKTGKVAQLFGVDQNTVVDWTNRYTEFFSLSARGVDESGQKRSQRDYLMNDLIVLNTIQTERANASDKSDWELIRAQLASGFRNSSLPPEATTISGESAIAVYSQLKVMETKLAASEAEVERLQREKLVDKEEKTSLHERIVEASREAERWKTRYEDLKATLDKNDDK